MNEQAIRAAMTQQIERTVLKGRVQWDRRFYHLDGERTDPDDSESDRWRSRLEGKKVLVRFLPARYEYVEIYTTDGQYVTKAAWSRYVDPADAADQAADRRAATKTLSTSLEAIAAQEVASKAALVHEALGDQIDDDSDFVTRTQPKPNSKKRAKAETPAAKKRRERAEERAAEIRAENREVMTARRTGTDDWF
ncbi:Mu transposase C-terminal domain-containing protein [Nocardioides panacis]|uniref:Mu transposase C-terminal domain-containing protein n=1 Tax=Nocardioides panacis TaxID=2849501 RepID=A0A975T4L3_9ACTN|nr:Mu transposase C-terminal domain-containing protein [Nocardioides panacis]QWZ10773.1 Mu transposase C-terminal domain-containing protein [Nocardioides panacis]